MSSELYKLYNMNSKKELKDYFLSLGDNFYSLLNDVVSSDLTFCYLYKLYNKENKYSPALLKELFLIDNKCEITPLGMNLVSKYPFFGNGGKEKTKYNSSFFLFLSSFLLNGKSDRFFSSKSFTSLFPNIDDEYIKKRAKLTLNTFKYYKIIKEDGSVNRESLLSFLSLDTLSKIIYITLTDGYNSSLESITFMLKCLSLVDNMKKNSNDRNIHTFLGDIESILFSTNTPKSRFDEEINSIIDVYSLLDIKSEYISSFDFSKDESSTLSVGSNFELSVKGNTLCPLFDFADPVKEDEVNIWNISKSSILRALNNGYSANSILETLQEYSKDLIPENVKERITSWEKSTKRITLYSGITIKTDDETSSLILKLPKIKDHVIEQISKNIFIMDEDLSSWYKVLEKAGYDILSKNQIFHNKKDTSHSSTFKNIEFSLSLKDFRIVPYDKEKYNSLLLSLDGYLEQSACSSSLLFEKRKLCPCFIDSFDYKKKESFLKDNLYEYVYVVLINGNVFISRVEQIYGNFDNLFVKFKNGNRYSFKDIFKLSSLPSSLHPL